MIPLTYAGLTFLVGVLFLRTEHHLLAHLVSTISPVAMGIRGAGASGTIALTGIVVSLGWGTTRQQHPTQCRRVSGNAISRGAPAV